MKLDMKRSARWMLPELPLRSGLIAPVCSGMEFERRVLRKDAGLEFGPLLREARKAIGMTQEALAERAGIDRTYTSLLERGLRNPSLVQLLNLGGALSLRPGLLVDLTGFRLGVTLPTLSRGSDLAARVRLSVNTPRLCHLRGLMLGQLAMRAGLDDEAVWPVAAGSPDTPIAHIDAVASGLSCDVGDLLIATR